MTPPNASLLGRRAARPGRRVALAALALTSAAYLAGCGSGEQVDWAIMESGPGGETLVVAPLIALRPCDGPPKADLNKSNANRVDLVITVERGSCSDEGARPAGRLSVELAQPLRGQQITGPGLRPPSSYPAAKTSGTVPSIVGLRVPDARAVLMANGLELDAIVGPKGDATEVTSQSPPAGAQGATTEPDDGAYRPTVSVRTVPR